MVKVKIENGEYHFKLDDILKDITGSKEDEFDLEEELKLPIIFYEDLYNYKAIFTITKESTIYKCIIKNQ